MTKAFAVLLALPLAWCGSNDEASVPSDILDQCRRTGYCVWVVGNLRDWPPKDKCVRLDPTTGKIAQKWAAKDEWPHCP